MHSARCRRFEVVPKGVQIYRGLPSGGLPRSVIRGRVMIIIIIIIYHWQFDHWQFQYLDTVLESLTGTKKNCKN